MNNLAVITGGSKGIGRAIVKKFASLGFDIATCARNQNDLNDLKHEIESNNGDIKCDVVSTDLGQKQGVKVFTEFVKSLDNPVNVLVNNVGIYLPGQIYNEEENVLQKLLNINLLSAYYVTKGLIDDMVERRQGHIFNIESIAGIQPYKSGSSYSISKYALHGMTKVLREEMKEFDVKVTAVIPGSTYTSTWEGVDLPEERFMKAEDVADAVYSAYALSPNSVVEEILIRPQLGDI